MQWLRYIAVFFAGWLTAMLLAATPYAGDISRVVGPGTAAQLQTPWGLRVAFAPFWETWQLVDSTFYDRGQIDHTRMIKGAIDGMLATLDDRYTFYQEPEVAEQTRDNMRGVTAGIGIYLRIVEGKVLVWRPIADAPAVKAGIQQDDQILAIDGDLVVDIIRDLADNDAVQAIASRIRGDVGTTVVLRLQRGDADPFDVTLTRAEIILPSVEWEVIDQDVGYIRISEFKGNSPDILYKGMRELTAQPLRGYVIDLRSNPGGLLDSAQRILGYFYEGTALWEQRSAGARRELLTIAPDGPVDRPTQPIVVLINADSASASEVVAGALRDKYPNARLIGVQSFGKGIVQSIYPLSNGGTARLTVSQWLTPNFSAIHKRGLTPNIIVEDADDAIANAPCVANRRPVDGQSQCRDPQLMRALEELQP
jgi:carboxyl-terminal processing protease